VTPRNYIALVAFPVAVAALCALISSFRYVAKKFLGCSNSLTFVCPTDPVEAKRYFDAIEDALNYWRKHRWTLRGIALLASMPSRYVSMRVGGIRYPVAIPHLYMLSARRPVLQHKT
jgi:hypothetical protein